VTQMQRQTRQFEHDEAEYLRSSLYFPGVMLPNEIVHCSRPMVETF